MNACHVPHGKPFFEQRKTAQSTGLGNSHAQQTSFSVSAFRYKPSSRAQDNRHAPSFVHFFSEQSPHTLSALHHDRLPIRSLLFASKMAITRISDADSASATAAAYAHVFKTYLRNHTHSPFPYNPLCNNTSTHGPLIELIVKDWSNGKSSFLATLLMLSPSTTRKKSWRISKTRKTSQQPTKPTSSSPGPASTDSQD